MDNEASSADGAATITTQFRAQFSTGQSYKAKNIAIEKSKGPTPQLSSTKDYELDWSNETATADGAATTTGIATLTISRMNDTITRKRTLPKEDKTDYELDWSDETATADGAVTTTGIATSRSRKTSYPYNTRQFQPEEAQDKQHSMEERMTAQMDDQFERMTARRDDQFEQLKALLSEVPRNPSPVTSAHQAYPPDTVTSIIPRDWTQKSSETLSEMTSETPSETQSEPPRIVPPPHMNRPPKRRTQPRFHPAMGLTSARSLILTVTQKIPPAPAPVSLPVASSSSVTPLMVTTPDDHLTYLETGKSHPHQHPRPPHRMSPVSLPVASSSSVTPLMVTTPDSHLTYLETISSDRLSD